MSDEREKKGGFWDLFRSKTTTRRGSRLVSKFLDHPHEPRFILLIPAMLTSSIGKRAAKESK